MTETRLLIRGEPVDGDGAGLAVENPCTEETIAAVAAGATVFAGGGGAGHARGHFFAPAVVTGAPAETELLREETFGPVAPIVPVRTLDEAIELADGTRCGLGCTVSTRDLDAIFRCMREIRAGMETRIAPNEWWYPYGGTVA